MTNRERYVRVAAYCLVLDAGRILLCRISEEISGAAGKWTLPGGGINFGEHPRDAAIREVLEETGLKVRVTELVEIDSVVFDISHGVRIIYRAEIVGGEMCCEVEGSTDQCGWFTPAEALELPLVSLARIGIERAFGE
jgi:ADP-ribose pyrophosphatase YjhB (NUDIX family)